MILGIKNTKLTFPIKSDERRVAVANNSGKYSDIHSSTLQLPNKYGITTVLTLVKGNLSCQQTNFESKLSKARLKNCNLSCEVSSNCLM